jgi:GTP1/Obg family GTP-binding protein
MTELNKMPHSAEKTPILGKSDIQKKTPTVALCGNPNCGKTTVFNLLTGSRHEVGNWPLIKSSIYPEPIL